MLNCARALGLAAVVALVVGCMSADKSSPSGSAIDTPVGGTSLDGAWRIAELRSAGLSATNPPSVYLFASTHYSIMYANTGAPRRTFANAGAPTDAEMKQAYVTFIANAGTYSIAGDTLILRPVIAKHPNYMGGGMDKFVTRLVGDTLWLRSVPGAFRWAVGQSSAPTDTSAETYRLHRMR